MAKAKSPRTAKPKTGKNLLQMPDSANGEAKHGNVRPDFESDIRLRAYELYEQRGRAAGQEEQDWFAAEQALRLLRDDSATAGLRVILTDHVLPGASGDAFVRELREFSPSVPVLVISGMDEAEQAYDGLEITFLHKPCAPEDLIAQVRAALKQLAGSGH